jgi:hypothetical protein
MAAHAVLCDEDAMQTTTISQLHLVRTTAGPDEGRDITSTTAAYPPCAQSTDNPPRGVLLFPPSASLHDFAPRSESNDEFLERWYSTEGGQIHSSIERILAVVDKVLRRAA